MDTEVKDRIIMLDDAVKKFKCVFPLRNQDFRKKILSSFRTICFPFSYFSTFKVGKMDCCPLSLLAFGRLLSCLVQVGGITSWWIWFHLLTSGMWLVLILILFLVKCMVPVSAWAQFYDLLNLYGPPIPQQSQFVWRTGLQNHSSPVRLL